MGKKYIESGDRLIEYFNSYVSSIKANPIKKQDFVGKDADEVVRKLERPLTWVGFECYLSEEGIINDLGDYEANTDNSYSEYQPAIKLIKKFIERDQFEGATVGIYNANIIARKLGLSDKQDVKLDVYDVKLNL